MDVKSESKLYKGEVKKVGDLLDLKRPTPVQPVKREIMRGGAPTTLPPSFIITKFSPGYYPGSRIMSYYNPKTRVMSRLDLPEEVELNVLSGTRGTELDSEWKTVVQSELSRVSTRISTSMGTDPEIFVVDKKGAVVPAWSFLGSKDKPNKWAEGSYHRGDLYWDGFQAEFTTSGQHTCLVELSNSLHYALRTLNNLKPKDSKLTLSSVIPVDPEVLSTAKEEHVAFGCAPSLNAYGLKGNTEEGRVVPYRFAGGHIHMGLNADQKKDIPQIVKALDAVLGVACVSLFAGYDSPVRRQFYGLAGEYRIPTHGLEYRVLSNAWLAHPAIFHMVFDLSRAVVGLVVSGLELSDVWATKEEDTLKAIMNSDVDLARSILRDNTRAFAQILYTAGYSYTSYQEKALGTWTGGMDTLIKDPKDIENNWSLSNRKWNESVRSFNTAAAYGSKV